jgi:hypothetical protein
MTTSRVQPSAGPFRGSKTPLSELEKAILLTVHYRDLFGHALTRDELHADLLHPCPDPEALAPALARLDGPYLTVRGAYVTWKGREKLVELRAHRQAVSEATWRWAFRFGRWVRTIPFLKMAGVTGSLAMNNADRSHDVDMFFVAEAHRLWLTIPLLSLLKHFSRRCLAMQFCPNTCLDENVLEFPDQNLYVAHQIVHLVPLWGEEVYRRFLVANRWIENFLPNARAGAKLSVPVIRTPCITRMLASALPKTGGNAVNARLYQTGLRHALNHARRHGGPSAETIAQARRLRCYRLVNNGYAPTVLRRFLEGHTSRFAGVLTRQEMQRAFGGDAALESCCEEPRDSFFVSKYGCPA